MQNSVLILGATGRFGRNAAEAFWNRGWRVHTFDRKTQDLTVEAAKVDVIVNGWNPVYTDWARDVPNLTQDVIAAAKSSGAMVIIPGNVYVYGSDAPTDFGEETRHGATNPLGQIRIDMEASYRDSGVKTLILRAGDYLDTEPSGNWFDQIIAAKTHRGTFSYPGNPDIPHAWAFLPDLTNAAVMLAEKREQLADFETIHFPGYTLTGHEMADLCTRALDRPIKLKRMSWLPLIIARPFWKMAKPLMEMRYLWNKPHRLTGTRLAGLLPRFHQTDPLTALSSALQHQINPDQPVAGRGYDVPAE